jgi:hypothetical protein
LIWLTGATGQDMFTADQETSDRPADQPADQ